jgi:hypothetical protein
MNANTNTAEFVFSGKTAAEWRKEAADCRNRSYESFERCDTDGFLSQWASDTMARRYDECADVAENGGRIFVTALFDLEGNFITADYREGQYGWYFLVPAEYVAKGYARFLTTSDARKATTRAKNNAKKGVTEGTVSVPAFVNHRSGIVEADWDAVRNGDVIDGDKTAHQTRDH